MAKVGLKYNSNHKTWKTKKIITRNMQDKNANEIIIIITYENINIK